VERIRAAIVEGRLAFGEQLSINMRMVSGEVAASISASPYGSGQADFHMQ
jgi:hypothetical protein